MPLIRCQPVQFGSLFQILFYTKAKFIAFSEHILRLSIPAPGSLGEPVERFVVVLIHSDAVEVKKAQIALCAGIALLCCLAVQLQRLFLILLHTYAVFIAPPKIALRLRIIAVCGKLV
ncbi:hypothetical protein D3C71_1551880 [compost metagenome]